MALLSLTFVYSLEIGCACRVNNVRSIFLFLNTDGDEYAMKFECKCRFYQFLWPVKLSIITHRVV